MANRNIFQDDKAKAERLKRLYHKKKHGLNLTQMKTAAKLNMTQSAISQYLNAIVPLNTDTILAFAKVLDVCPGEIDPALSYENFGPKMLFQYVPVIGTLSNAQPTRYAKRLWVKRNAGAIAALEIDEKTKYFDAGTYLILNLNKRPVENSNVVIRLKKESHFQIGTFLGDNEYRLNNKRQQLKDKDIAFLVTVAEVIKK